MKRSIVLLFALSFIIGLGLARAQNKIMVENVTGNPDTNATVAITVTSDKDLAGICFTIKFDPTKLQISATAIGAAAAKMDTVGVNVDSANSDGLLEVCLLDFTVVEAGYFTNPIVAGENQEIFMVTFTVNAEEEIPIELIDVSLSDSEAQDIWVTIINGTINKGF